MIYLELVRDGVAEMGKISHLCNVDTSPARILLLERKSLKVNLILSTRLGLKGNVPTEDDLS